MGRRADCTDTNHLLFKDPRHALRLLWECPTSRTETDRLKMALVTSRNKWPRTVRRAGPLVLCAEPALWCWSDRTTALHLPCLRPGPGREDRREARRESTLCSCQSGSQRHVQLQGRSEELLHVPNSLLSVTIDHVTICKCRRR